METFNPLESQILAILENHQGKDSSIPREDLVNEINSRTPLFPKDERKIRETIKHLTTQHGIAIGSCHYGYFIPITAEEIEEVCEYYDGYGLSLLFVSSQLRKRHLAEHLGQLALTLTTDTDTGGKT